MAPLYSTTSCKVFQQPKSYGNTFNHTFLIQGIETWTDFYIPDFDEAPNFLSGMVIALFEKFPEPGFAYISKEEDTDRVHKLLKDTIDWKKPNSIGPICDWHDKQFLELCKKNVTIKVEITLSQWVLQPSTKRPKLESNNNS